VIVLLSSLQGRGRGWVGERSSPLYVQLMHRIPPILTERARQLRRDSTPAERKLWRLLSRYRPAFTRQLVVGNYIIDLACREAKLAIELDGSQLSIGKTTTQRAPNI